LVLAVNAGIFARTSSVKINDDFYNIAQKNPVKIIFSRLYLIEVALQSMYKEYKINE
jgi:hypothetical protein